MNLFLKEPEAYQRETEVMKSYMEQLSLYIQLRTNKTKEQVDGWLEKEFKEGRFKYNSPLAMVNVRDPKTGDKVEKRMELAKLVDYGLKNLTVSPSLAFMQHPTKKRSLLSVYTDQMVAERNAAKAAMFAARDAGDIVLETIKKNEQNSKKILNNGKSGAYSSRATILSNKSTHSILSSTCRTATAYGNASNEKLSRGNRHYWSSSIIINNILATCTITNFKDFTDFMFRYKLVYPSVEDTMQCIHYSADRHFINPTGMVKVRKLIESLSPIQRAAFVYIGDMYHIRKYNPEVMVDFLDALTKVETTPIDESLVSETEAKLNSDLIALIVLRCSDITMGAKLSSVKESDYSGYKVVLANVKSFLDGATRYKEFIREIILSDNVPASVARLPDVMRTMTLVSDTDSTMGNYQDWCEWYVGTPFGKEADVCADTMIFLCSTAITHLMGRMSAQLGVERSNIHRYSMKNEFKFGVFSLVNIAKHYFSLMTAQEGMVFSTPELELKGVALRSSNIPIAIMNGFRNKLVEISSQVMRGEKINIIALLNHVADIENDIRRSVEEGDFVNLKAEQVRDKESYAVPESANYAYYGWWEETFGPKYGSPGAPPYGAVGVNVVLENKTAIKQWIDTMEDRALAGRIKDWHSRNPKRTFTRLLLPETIVGVGGIPKEILDIVDYRKIIFASLEPYYHMLECFKVSMIDKNRTKLVSDYYGTKK